MGIPSLLLFLSTFESIHLSIGTDQNKQARYASVGLTDDFNGLLKARYELGYWSDKTNRSSAYGAYQIGLVASNDILYADFFTGASLISQSDSRLSTPFEFKHDIGIGVVGKNKVGIGINYSHLSNAGIKQPNLGRDLIQFKVVMPIRD